MIQDIRLAARSWLRTPRLALTLLACIALAIGGTATVLTFVHAILLAPLPYPHADRLVNVLTQEKREGFLPNFSHPDFEEIAARSRSFEQISGTTVFRQVLITAGGAERLRGEVVPAGYFEILGVRPALGRFFTADELAGRGERVVVISERLWRASFGADASVIGRSVETASGMRTVVGVAPLSYSGQLNAEGSDFWLPDGQHPNPAGLARRTSKGTRPFGLLKPGVSVAQATSEMQALALEFARAHPAENRELRARVEPFAETWRGPLRGGLLMMLVASGFLLLIGCANVAMLLLARLVTRERELAVRVSLGADRRALIRLMLAESLVLAVVGGALGLGLAQALIKIFLAVGQFELPVHIDIGLTAGPLALSAVVVLLTGLLFGLLPAFAAARVDLNAALRAGGRGLAGNLLQGRSGAALIVGQTALAVALLAGAALFVRSYDRLRAVDLGYRTHGLLRTQVSLLSERYRTPAAMAQFFDALQLDLAALPGIRGAGYLAPTLPPYSGTVQKIRGQGTDLPTADGALDANIHFATTEVLDLMAVPLREGRRFGSQDRLGGTAVTLVSETLAHRLAPNGSALGRALLLADNTEVIVIGVVADTLSDGLRRRTPNRDSVYLSLRQFPQISVGILFDCSVNPHSVVDSIRKVVVAHDPAASLHWVGTVDEALDGQSVNDRFWTILTTAYAGTAFLLAVVGLYGVLSHGVARRTQEIGVRMALGASAGSIARMVVGQGFRLVSLGLFAGLGLTLLLGHWIESYLYGTDSTDPVALLGAAGILLLVALLACWLPARRAARTDPLVALRSE